MDKQALKERQQQILSLIRGFCTEKLDEEYYALSEKLVQKLGRKRNPIIETGQVQIWAAAVIHALGVINFLSDRSFEPYATTTDINDYFGTNKSTVGNKSKQIRDLLKLRQFDSEFSTAAIREDNPDNNLVMVNGFLVPLDSLPEQIQEAVYQARAKGLNPVITLTPKHFPTSEEN